MKRADLIGLAQLVFRYPEQPSPARLRELKKLKWVADDGRPTLAGREALHEGVIEADARAARGLGNSHEARTRGARETNLGKAQEYLDLSNFLRGCS